MLMKWLTTGLVIFAALPATTTYQLNSFGFGSGGTANSTTSNYALEGITGEVSGQTSATATYSAKPGFVETQQAHVPKLTSLDNASGLYYNKLHFVIDQQGNPNDALYAISISTDNFVADTKFIKNDFTVTPTLSLTDYQTYTTWGGGSGGDIIGLLPNTLYYVRLKATQGTFTESGYGPVSSATTASPSLSFSISTNALTLPSLIAATVVDAPATIDVTFATNATSGGDVYINGLNSGLISVKTGFTITSATADLTPATRGFGAKVTTTGASSGTFSSVSPYNGVSNNIGLTDVTIRRILTASAPVIGGTGSVLLKAKSAASDPSSNDYTETLTMLASASF
ncbi:hypothetical protein BH10PAT3_BH10PAT3_3020 [soil metagenome]